MQIGSVRSRPRRRARAAALCAAALLPALLFGACARSSAGALKTIAARLSGGFSCAADVKWTGGTASVTLDRTQSGDCALSFVEPKELNSLTFATHNGTLDVQYADLSVSVDPQTIPQTAVFNVVQGVFDAAVKPENVRASKTSAGYTLEGKTAAGAFTLAFDDSCTPVSLTLPAAGVAATFTAFRVG